MICYIKKKKKIESVKRDSFFFILRKSISNLKSFDNGEA